MKQTLCFLLLLLSYYTNAQPYPETSSVKLYQQGANIVMSDTADGYKSIWPIQNADGRYSVSVQNFRNQYILVKSPIGTQYYTPYRFKASNGVSYSPTSVSASVAAYQAQLSSSGSSAVDTTQVATKAYVNPKLIALQNTATTQAASLSTHTGQISAIQSNTATSTETANAGTINGYGDSMTEGQEQVTYLNWLASFTGLYPGNYGIGGQTSAQIKARFDANSGQYNLPHIFWVGKNDVLQGLSMTTLKSNIAAMVAALGHTRYLIIGVLPSRTEITGTANATTINTLNSDLAAIYGSRFINPLPIVQAGGTGAGQDATDVTNGVAPFSLHADVIHLNSKGDSILARGMLSYLPLLKEATSQNKYLTVGDVPSLVNAVKLTQELAVGGSYKIGNTRAVYMPDQKSTQFLNSIVFGNGGRFLSHTTGSEGQSNTFVGINAGGLTTTGNGNTFLGTGAGYTNTTGSNNVAFGVGALYVNTTGGTNVAVGQSALFGNTTGSGNTALGQSSANANTTGSNNVYAGLNAGIANTTGSNNVLIGKSTAAQSSTISTSVSLGTETLLAAGAKADEVAIGYQAGNAVSTGLKNTFIGSSSGNTVSSGNHNTALGYAAQVPTATSNDQVSIQNSLYCLNCTGTGGTAVAGNWGIGTKTPDAKAILDLNSTTLYLLAPRMTTTQRDAISSPTEGATIYNLTSHALEFHNGSVWKTVTTN